mgnify:CR=1 FL=1
MVSKNQKKLIKSLYQKKYRKQHKMFVAEGKKVICELMDAGLELHALFTIDVSAFDVVHQKLVYEVTQNELKQLSFLTTPQVGLAVFYIPQQKEVAQEALILALDDVRDPGNLGTIIRLCDWFGVKNLVCSLKTADCFNPKVIQATMGSITRVNVIYVDLPMFLKERNSGVKVFGTFMEGSSVYNETLPENGIIVMGNEANGISEDIEKFVDAKITIPRFGLDQKTESLNVATATAVILSEFKRR